jgi:tetratricopeptide (TPR) repeat protein
VLVVRPARLAKSRGFAARRVVCSAQVSRVATRACRSDRFDLQGRARLQVSPRSEVTQTLQAIAEGNPDAVGQLLPLVYEELRRAAAHRQELAVSHNSLGVLLHQLRKGAAAEEQHRRALAIREKLAAAFPAVPVHRQELARSLNNLGLVLAEREKQPEAEKRYRQALAIREKLAADFPAVRAHQVELGGSACNFGLLLSDGGRPGESLVWYEKAIRTLTPVYNQDRRLVLARQRLRNSHWGRAIAYDRLRKYPEAVRDWDRAVELSPRAEQPPFRADRASARARAGQVAEAVAEVAELMKLRGVPAPVLYNFACVYSLASAAGADRKQEHADQAMQLLRQAVKAGYQDAARMKKDPDLAPFARARTSGN